jgi:hypothetical protein
LVLRASLVHASLCCILTEAAVSILPLFTGSSGTVLDCCHHTTTQPHNLSVLVAAVVLN